MKGAEIEPEQNVTGNRRHAIFVLFCFFDKFCNKTNQRKYINTLKSLIITPLLKKFQILLKENFQVSKEYDFKLFLHLSVKRK